MSAWLDHILNAFQPELARLWIAADPDSVMLDETVLAGLTSRGFEVLRFEDSLAFRVEYESRYREPWDRGEPGSAAALILHADMSDISELPWDYTVDARVVRLSLAELFPKFSYGVVREIESYQFAALFDMHERNADHQHGESETKDFILAHLYGISPRLIDKPEDLWRDLLRLHYRHMGLPSVLAERVARVVKRKAAFHDLPIADFCTDRAKFLRVIEDSWERFASDSTRAPRADGKDAGERGLGQPEIAFDHPDIRMVVDSMFLDGTLRPLMVADIPSRLPSWMRVGFLENPSARVDLVRAACKLLLDELPTEVVTHREWSAFAQRLGEVLARWHALGSTQAKEVANEIQMLRGQANERFLGWLAGRYDALSSLPAARSPVMLHHVPRYLALHRNGVAKIVHVVMDGLAVDQWVVIREWLNVYAPGFTFEEHTCFAWLPTLTAVSRQALFAGCPPREFANTIETTAQESKHWTRFWQDQGLRPQEIFYRKALKRLEQLPELRAALDESRVKAAGLVVDTVDEFVHGAALGKREVRAQIENWCETGFVAQLFNLWLEAGFSLFVTSDHGNVEAIGAGRPNQGVIADERGERVRIYRSESLLEQSRKLCPGSLSLKIAGLPGDFLPLFAAGGSAFVPQGEPVVTHGGLSMEEVVVPFVKVGIANRAV
ncbi:MAG: BREX-3 system phosphatase PglZ [Gammaproteobacteria bacterium]